MKLRFALPLLAALALAGCRSGPTALAPEAPRVAAGVAAEAAPGVEFSDITRAAGIAFTHHNGAFGEKLMPESVGSGAAFFDYDGDGLPDIFLVNGRDWNASELSAYRAGLAAKHRRATHQPPPVAAATTGALLRNNGNGTFSDVTRGSGLDVEMFGMGVAVGDYDNDGRPDLYVTGLGRSFLFHNVSTSSPSRSPRFVDVAGAAGVRDGGWGTSAAWVDFDRDGRLDLFVCHYLVWKPALDVFASEDGQTKRYTGPLSYAPDSNHLFRNVGGGRFVDVSRCAGISRELSGGRPLQGGSLGVAVCDFNGDGWPDLAVTNDQRPNFLFQNQKNGTFAEVAAPTGLAYSNSGRARAGMGIDAGDVDGSGRDSILIGNYADEMLGLYQNRGGLFTDTAPRSEVGRASQKYLTFGCALLDVDNDGRLDIFAANGHVDDVQSALPAGVTYAQRPLLLLNRDGQFREAGTHSPALSTPLVARGLCYADIDLDGDLDLLITTNDGPPLLLRNDESGPNHALRLILRGARSNRSALGARVQARAGGRIIRRTVRSGSSFLSASELPLTLGLGPRDKVDELSIEWPSGARTRLKDVASQQILEVDEARGVVARRALRKQPSPRLRLAHQAHQGSRSAPTP